MTSRPIPPRAPVDAPAVPTAALALLWPAILALALQWLPGVGLGVAAAHEVSCAKLAGLELARCERHQRMFVQCGPLKGDAHFRCDRDFMLAHPLPCQTLQGDDAQACNAELSAAQACQPQQDGRAFMRCVRDRSAAVPGKP